MKKGNVKFTNQSGSNYWWVKMDNIFFYDKHINTHYGLCLFLLRLLSLNSFFILKKILFDSFFIPKTVDRSLIQWSINPLSCSFITFYFCFVFLISSPFPPLSINTLPEWSPPAENIIICIVNNNDAKVCRHLYILKLNTHTHTHTAAEMVVAKSKN